MVFQAVSFDDILISYITLLSLQILNGSSFRPISFIINCKSTDPYIQKIYKTKMLWNLWAQKNEKANLLYPQLRPKHC